MAYSSHIQSNLSGKPSGGGGSSTSAGNQGRVVHVILSDKDPMYRDPSMINGVFYRITTQPGLESDLSKLPFAYQGNPNSRVIPLPGEVVVLANGNSSESQTSQGANAKYWTGIVNVWNHPHHGVSPDTTQENWRDKILGGIQEKKGILPLQAGPGDYILEGRLNQSIRIGGYSQGTIPYITQQEEGEPVIVISNGRLTQQGISSVEDINTDSNSIYLLSNHKVPLKQAVQKKDSYDVAPIEVDQYKGNQVLVNAGRLVFNAKEDNILLSAKQGLGLNADTLNLDAVDYFCVDAKKIYLGAGARRAKAGSEPVILGTQLENWLTTLLDTLGNLGQALTSAAAVSGGPVTQLNVVGPEVTAVVKALKTQINIIKSKKVYTE